MAALIRLAGITKAFGKRVVLNKWSIDVHHGESTLISGPSGSGKTTLLRIMALLEKPDLGRIEYRSVDVTDFATKPLAAQEYADLRIGYVSQDLDLWPHMSVEDNVGLALALKGHATATIRQKVDQALTTLGIIDHREKVPAELSGGERQRCAIARCLVHEPDLLLLDEITASLDSDNVLKVFGCIGLLIAKGTTVIMVSHEVRSPNLMFTKHLSMPVG